MAGMRLTGLASGLDTENIVKALSQANQVKIDNVKKKQTITEWKKEAWTALNTKLYNFYKDSLDMFKSISTYNAKAVSGSYSGVKITATPNAASGVHKVKVNETAVAQMWTGDKIGESASAKLTDLGIADGTIITVNGKDITVDTNTTLANLASSMQGAGINASYDAAQGRFYLSSKSAGLDNKFEITSSDPTALDKLGLDLAPGAAGRIEARDASITYNGVVYEQSSNVFTINGLTITAEKEGDEQTFNVELDTQGIYDKIKGFVKEYNALIEEMQKLYSAPSAKDYKPLTQEEKDAMSDDEIEKWEAKIKESVLRRDDTIGGLLSGMRTILSKSVEVTGADGTTSKFSLSSFGIVTGAYQEKGKLHINGDSSDSDFAMAVDKLMAALSSNPDAVAKTFSAIGNELYSKLQEAMKRTDLSSALTFYNDKQMDKEIGDYNKQIKSLQEKLEKEQDKYYKQFAAMETAMAKLQAQQTYLGQLFAGGMGMQQ